jgi:hypothetical protein
MSLARRIKKLEATMSTGGVGCSTCCDWADGRDRILRCLADDPWCIHDRCPDCGRTPAKYGLVDLIREEAA